MKLSTFLTYLYVVTTCTYCASVNVVSQYVPRHYDCCGIWKGVRMIKKVNSLLCRPWYARHDMLNTHPALYTHPLMMWSDVVSPCTHVMWDTTHLIKLFRCMRNATLRRHYDCFPSVQKCLPCACHCTSRQTARTVHRITA